MDTPSTFNQVSVWVALAFFFVTTRHIPFGSFLQKPLHWGAVSGLHKDDRGWQGEFQRQTLDSFNTNRSCSPRKDFGVSFHSFQKDWSVSQPLRRLRDLTATSIKQPAEIRGSAKYLCTWANAAILLSVISKIGSRFKDSETETWQRLSQCPMECLCQDRCSLGESPHRRGVRKGSKASATYGERIL